MTYQEYQEKVYSVKQKHNAELFSIARDYALSNNNVKVGDIIEDFSTRIKVENIKTQISFGVPKCVYEGTQLNKDGSVRKRQDSTIIYQWNLERFLENKS